MEVKFDPTATGYYGYGVYRVKGTYPLASALTETDAYAIKLGFERFTLFYRGEELEVRSL